MSKDTTLFAVANAVLLCLLVSRTPAVAQRDANPIAHVDFPSAREYISTTVDNDQHGRSLATVACDCGPHSKKCELQNGAKVCQCKYLYRQEGEICKAWCSENYQCRNGGMCVNESCQCLPGTSGEFCKTVDACKGVKGPYMCGDPYKVLCWYNVETQKPYCMCRIIGFIYYPKERRCIECDCGEHGSCSLVNGKKTCKCNKGTALKQERFFGDIVERCKECRCGNNSDGCSFDGLYNKICNCRKGTAQQPDVYGDSCNECDCGPHGQCYFKGWYQYCNCDEGYKPFLNINRTELICKECDCGNGVCSFYKEVKQCECNPGFALRDGICTDIDECLNSSNSCPSTTNCVNTIGSYECACKGGGYILKSAGSDPKI